MNKIKSIKAGIARPERDRHLYDYWKTHKTTKAAASRMFRISKQQGTVIINRMRKKEAEECLRVTFAGTPAMTYTSMAPTT